jgi:4'-phosphopantetheinyl transferase EntD
VIDHVDESRAALHRIAPAGVLVGAATISAANLLLLYPAERALIGSAVERRRNEFATGRVLLRSLIGRDEPVLTLISRAPAIPDDVVATLAHDHDVAVAAVATRASAPSIRSLGIDIETIGAVEVGAAGVVCRDDESGLDPTMVFVAKEAAYKAWSNSGGGMLDHHDVRIEVDAANAPQAFRAEIVPTGDVVRGMIIRTSTRWLAIACVDAPR